MPDTEKDCAATSQPGTVVDDVFGAIGADGVNYRDVGWLGTSVLMAKAQIGLGVLAIPSAFHTLGLVPGLICLITIGAMTTWSDYIVGVFKLNHPLVYNIDDVGDKFFGKPGRIIFGGAFVLLSIFCAAAAIIGVSVALNALSDHGACTAVFIGVAAISGGALASIHTLSRISWLAWIGVICILSSIMIVTVAVAVQGRPVIAPEVSGPWKSDWKLFGNPSFAEAVAALVIMVFAYAGTPSFFSIISEMRDPRQYTKAMVLCQGTVTTIYVVVGIVIYIFCGSFVATPALGSAGPVMKTVCYGVALPGLLVSCLLFIHLPAKYCFVRLLAGSRHLTENTFQHWAIWLSCTASNTVVAYIIASTIPNFGGLMSFVGAFLGTLMCFQSMGGMWLYDNWHKGKNNRSTKWLIGVCWSVFVIAIGTFLMIAGSYGSLVGIIDSYNATGGSAAFSCMDNSKSIGDTH